MLELTFTVVTIVFFPLFLNWKRKVLFIVGEFLSVTLSLYYLIVFFY